MRVIFVPVADRPECAIALRTAFNLGRRLGSNILGCHIRAHSDSAIALPSSLDSLANRDAAWERAWSGKKTHKSDTAAEGLFASVAAQQDYEMIKKPRSTPGAVWLEKVGSPDKVLSIMGPVSDLIVVSRPAARGGALARLFMMAALLNSSRPVLVLPRSAPRAIGRKICIAWNQSTEAALAVAAAMPLLRMADQVHIISSGPQDGIGPKSTQLATYLRFWGIKAERTHLHEKDEAKALIKGFNDTDSDLLVMGAYSRSRLRQRIFGGITEFMLQRAKIPVFMLHP